MTLHDRMIIISNECMFYCHVYFEMYVYLETF